MQKSWIEKNEIIIFYFVYDWIMSDISIEMIKNAPPVRKSPVPDRSSSEKSSEESAPLRPVENS